MSFMPTKTKRTYAHRERDRAAELERVSITVPREEWDALHAMRERTEIAMATHRALEERFLDLLRVNAEQLARMTKMSMENDHVRVSLTRAETREELLASRVKHLEQLLTAPSVAKTDKTEAKGEKT